MTNALVEESIYRELAAEQWELGSLDYKLYDYQLPLYNKIKNQKSLSYIVNCRRRYGKSHVVFIRKFEQCLQNKDFIVRYAAPEQEQLKLIYKPIFDDIVRDAPDSVKPVYKKSDRCYYFPKTNSAIFISGCNNGNDESLRGNKSDANVIDEAGSITRLEYLYKDILLPQTLTTRGLTTILSTPPPTPAHYFKTMADIAKANGNYSKYTIDDNDGSVDAETLQLFIDESGGIESTTWRREFKCEFVVDEKLAIISKWDTRYIQKLEKEDEYKFYHHYVFADWGVRDKTALIFATYDYKRAKLILEHEKTFANKDVTTKSVANYIKATTPKLWGNSKVYRYIGDNDLQIINDMNIDYGLPFVSTDKTDLFAMVNATKVFIESGLLIVEPELLETIGNLENGVWNKTFTSFERTELYGHFDLLAALIYGIRNIDRQTNPIPHDYYINYQRDWSKLKPKENAFAQAFGVKTKNNIKEMFR